MIFSSLFVFFRFLAMVIVFMSCGPLEQSSQSTNSSNEETNCLWGVNAIVLDEAETCGNLLMFAYMPEQSSYILARINNASTLHNAASVCGVLLDSSDYSIDIINYSTKIVDNPCSDVRMISAVADSIKASAQDAKFRHIYDYRHGWESVLVLNDLVVLNGDTLETYPQVVIVGVAVN